MEFRDRRITRKYTKAPSTLLILTYDCLTPVFLSDYCPEMEWPLKSLFKFYLR
jgi:hypothetical protein